MALPLIALDVLITAAFAIGCCLAIVSILNSVAQLVAPIPGIGGTLAKAINACAAPITGVLGSAERGIDAHIGGSLHALAQFMNMLWQQIVSTALAPLQLAELVAKLVYAHSGLRSLVHSIEATVHGIGHGAKSLERKFHGIDARLRTLEREYLGIDVTHVGKRLGKVEQDIANIAGQTIPAIQKADQQASSAIADLYNWVKGVGSIAGVGTIAAVVAAAVAAIGNGWLACKENPFSSSKNPCSLWGDLARFMPLLGLLALAFDFPAFVTVAEDVASGIGSAVSSIEGSFSIALPPLPPPTT